MRWHLTLIAPRTRTDRAPNSSFSRALTRSARVRSGSRLSRALHPPRRHFELKADRALLGRRHLQVEGLPHQRPRPAQDNDARGRRVHPPFSLARAAQRLPPHPPLRPVRRHGPSPQHRARPPSARRAQGLAPERERRGRQRGRRRFVSPPMPMLWRPDDRRRNVRGPAPRTLPTAKPDQDRIPPRKPDRARFRPRAGAGGRRPLEVVSPSPIAAPAPAPRILATELDRHHRFRRQDCAPPAPAPTRPSRPRSSNPHSSRPTKPRPFLPAVSSFTITLHHNPSPYPSPCTTVRQGAGV